MLQKLEERQLLDNTLVIVTETTDKEFITRIIGDGSNYSPAQVRVPFLLYTRKRTEAPTATAPHTTTSSPP